MKDKLLGFGFIVTILGGLVSPVWSETDLATLNKNSVDNIVNITPANLVNSAYQGRFVDLGVPPHQAFTTAIKLGRVDSQLLVKSAIDSGRLEPEMINNRRYLNTVEDLLDSLNRD